MKDVVNMTLAFGRSPAYIPLTMQELSDDDRREILGEVLMDELKIIREYLQDLLPLKKDVAQLKEVVAELKMDREWIKRMLVKHDLLLDDHERRIGRIEAVRS